MPASLVRLPMEPKKLGTHRKTSHRHELCGPGLEREQVTDLRQKLGAYSAKWSRQKLPCDAGS